jgi:hypothetical protein
MSNVLKTDPNGTDLRIKLRQHPSFNVQEKDLKS